MKKIILEFSKLYGLMKSNCRATGVTPNYTVTLKTYNTVSIIRKG